MPLGKQFRNTYWEDENGNANTYVDTGNDSPFFGNLSHKSESHIHDKPLQGLLFDPYTGTGLKQDPSVHPIQRTAVAANALGWPEDERLTQALVNSGIPMQTMRKINTRAGVNSAPDRYGVSGQYEDVDNTIDISPTVMHSPNTTAETLTHEIGHHLDRSIHTSNGGRLRFLDPVYTEMWDDPDGPVFQFPKGSMPEYNSNRKQGSYADPVEEGKADAFMDRTHTFSNSYEHKIPELVAKRMADSSSDRGYGFNNNVWEANNDEHTATNQALYAATRILASKSDSAGSNLKNRSEVLTDTYGNMYATMADLPNEYDFPLGFEDRGYSKAAEEARQNAQHINNKTLLGHYVSKNPGLISTLSGVHPVLGEAAKAAHAHFKSIEPADMTELKSKRETAKRESGEQLRFDV
jgi:hypothetical protein